MLEARRASQIDFAPDGTPIVVGNSNAGGLPLFSIIQVPLNSERLGFLSLAKDNGLLSGDVFVDAYNELVKLSLTGNEPSIITMAEYEAEILAKGKCSKFGLSITDKQFKIPFVPGVFLQSKESSADTGVWTPDQLQGHWHNAVGDNIIGVPSTGSVPYTTKDKTQVQIDAPTRWGAGNPVSDGINGIPRIGTKTKPESISVDYQMKLYGTLTNKAQVDMADVVTQLTSKFDIQTYENDIDFRIKAFAYVKDTGEITFQKGFVSCVRNSTGNYTLIPISTPSTVLAFCSCPNINYRASITSMNPITVAVTGYNTITPVDAVFTVFYI